MVFESLVSDLLNRFIGDYVENLDKSQLKIGIWGGNVVLENLRVKENALSEFDVPFRVKAGQIGRLTLKIPWKNLYNDAVVATLDGLYLLVVPGATGSQLKTCPYNAIKYDAAKEEHYQQEVKQRELNRIEEALQKAARRASQSGDLLFSLESVVYKEPHSVPKGSKKHKKHKKGLKKLKRHDNKTEKPQEEKKDTFVEKLATQVIKNLQVKISSIHLRYEDDLSDPQHPLSMGVTLSELSLQTTDENWKSCILNEAAKIIYKLGRLECLCAYWNVNSPIFCKGSWEDVVEQLKNGISSKDEQLPHYQYIFRPLFASAKMCINPNADLELKTPKANLHLEVQNIALEMTKPQYLTMVEMLESIDCMVKNAPYRKFRPDVPVHKNAKIWWKYSFNSILEGQIRRCSHMWSWSNIKQHRENLKCYKTAYKAKLLTQSKPSQVTEQQIQDLEKVLDVFNITLARQQAQMEVIRSGQKVVGKKLAGGPKQGGGGGFFSSLFGRKAKKEEQEQEESKEMDSAGLDELMTAEEKEKLYTAIGYSGSSHNLTLPKQYVAVVITFQLLRTSVTVREQPDVPEILKIQMLNLSTKISQRPGGQAIRVEVALDHWYVTGLQHQGVIPSLIASVGDSSSSLLSVLFELNPEESTADQLLRVHSQPVEIIYDALTVNSMAEFFKTGKGVDLEVLTSATLSKLEEIKEKTATGLSHIIETRKVLDLRIDLKPSYLLVPKSGFYSDMSDLIIIDFGSLQLNSVEQSGVSSSSSSFSSLEEIMDRAYERYNVELRRVQVLYSKSGEDWKLARLQASSVQHILQPMDFTVQLAKCMVDKDARMPRFKVSGELPLLHIKISDQKIQNVLELADTIPLPNMGSSPSTPTEKVLSLADARPRVLSLPPALLDTMETDSDEDTSEKSTDEDHQRLALEELTDVHFKFEVREVVLELTRQVDQEKTILSFSICQLGAEGKRRSFDLSITSYLRRVTLDYCGDGRNHPLHLISSSEQQGSNLLKVEFIKADPIGPSFQTLFDNTEQTLKVEFSSLDFLLHTKALLSTINYLNTAVPPQLTAAQDRDAKKQVEKTGQGRMVSKEARDGGIFSFKLFAMLGCFHVEVCDDHCSIADIRVQGIDASVSVQAKETEVFARLRDIVVTDVDPRTIHKKHGEPLSPAASTLAMVLTRGLSMEQQKSSRDSLQYSSGYSTQTNTPSCSEDTIPSQGSDYECYSLNGDADSEGQADFDKSSTIPRHSNIAQSYRRMIQTKRPASTAGLPAGKAPQGTPNGSGGSGSGTIASGTATIRRTPSSKTGVRRTPSTSGPIPIRPPIVPVKTPTVPDSPGYASPSQLCVGSEEFLYSDDPSVSDYMRASPKRMSLPDTTWGCGGGGADRAVYAQQAPGMTAHSAEEDPLLAANRHSLVEKIGELAASAHALGEGHFPFPSSLLGGTAQCGPQELSSATQEDVDMLVSIRRGVKLRKTVTDDRSAPRILR